MRETSGGGGREGIIGTLQPHSSGQISAGLTFESSCILFQGSFEVVFRGHKAESRGEMHGV